MATRAFSCVILLAACGGTGGWQPGFVDAPVAAVATEVAGQVATVSVNEGQIVKRGQLLARLDARESEANVTVAEARVARARQSLAEVERDFQAAVPTTRGATAEVAQQRATVAQTQLDYARAKELYAKGVSSKAELDVARTRLDQARAGATARSASQQSTTAKVAASAAAVASAEAAVKSAEAELAVAQVHLAQADLKSPFDGLVVQVNLRPGEWAAPGTPIVTVEDLAHQWVRLDIPENRLGQLAVGTPAEIRVVARSGKTYEGHVIEIGAEGEFALDRDVKRGRADLRTFRVRVGLDDAAADLRPGMTAQVAARAPAAEAAR